MTALTEEFPDVHGSRTSWNDTRLDRVRDALSALSMSNVHALRAVALEPTDIAPGLMLWIEHATGWEIDRRAQRAYVLHDPLDAIDFMQISPSILALAALSLRFGHEHQPVAAFFSATIECLNLQPVMH